MLRQNIKKLRKQSKLSQEELARKAGVTYSTVAKVEGGASKNPTLGTLKKIAGVFGVGLDELVG